MERKTSSQTKPRQLLRVQERAGFKVHHLATVGQSRNGIFQNGRVNSECPNGPLLTMVSVTEEANGGHVLKALRGRMDRCFLEPQVHLGALTWV